MVTNSKERESWSFGDWLKWILILVVLFGGLYLIAEWRY